MLHSPAFLRGFPPLNTLFGSLVRRYAALFHHRYIVQRRAGVLLLLDQKNAVDKRLLCRGAWEPDQIAFLTQKLKEYGRHAERMVFLDIGSHGAFYPLALRSAAPFDEMVAFEPAPVNLAQLRANLVMNQCHSLVEVVEAAVSDEEGDTAFIVAADVNRGMSRIAHGGVEPGESLINVKTITIDAFRTYRECFVTAKIDIEGGEMRALRGMIETLRNNRCLLQVERHGDAGELYSFMNEAGFIHLRTIGSDYFFTNCEASRRQELAG